MSEILKLKKEFVLTATLKFYVSKKTFEAVKLNGVSKKDLESIIINIGDESIKVNEASLTVQSLCGEELMNSLR